MLKTILNIDSIQQMNLFSKITGVTAKNCFNYGNSFIFVVDSQLFSRAMGSNRINLRKLSYTFKKNIRIIRLPESNDIEEFIKVIIYPLRYKKISNEDGNVIISSCSESKAPLIGRDHSKINQLSEILKQYFNIKSVKIV